MGFDFQHARNQFPALALADAGKPRIHFDAPGGTQVPQRVVEQMTQQLITSNANSGGAFSTSRQVDAMTREFRLAAADLLGAPSEQEIVFGASMTSMTFAVSRAIGRQLQPGDEIIVTRMDHDGNVAPWLLLARDLQLVVRWLEFDPGRFRFDLAALKALITPRTRLAALGHASNLLGTVNPIAEMAALLRKSGVWVYVDGVQFVPHHPLDVSNLGCDFYVCSAYKFFGPHQAVLWGRGELLAQLEAYRVRPASDQAPAKFEVGTSSFEGQAGVLAAIEYLAALETPNHEQPLAGPARRVALRRAMRSIAEYEQQLGVALLEGLLAIPGVRIIGCAQWSELESRVPTVSLVVEGHSSADLATALAREGIFCWAGGFYAYEIVNALNLNRGGALRLGLTHYNTLEEVQRTLAVIRRQVA